MVMVMVTVLMVTVVIVHCGDQVEERQAALMEAEASAQERVDSISAAVEAQEKVVAELQRRDKDLERAFRESLKEVAQAPLEPDVLKLLTSLYKRRCVCVTRVQRYS